MTNNFKHFEELWEFCENFHKKNIKDSSSSSIIDELSLKVKLYSAINANEKIPNDDKKILKNRALGEIMLTLTHLSLIDDINVFSSLSEVLNYNLINYFSKKHD